MGTEVQQFAISLVLIKKNTIENTESELIFPSTCLKRI